MAQPDFDLTPLNPSQLLCDDVSSHPEFQTASIEISTDTHVRIQCDVQVPMVQAYVAKGSTPEGVRPIETLWLDFVGPEPSMRAPEVSLRQDFPSHLAHIQPWRGPEDRIIPCFLWGDPDELLHARGLGAVLDQVISWLEDAADGKLINPEHGWEPTRRDGIQDDVIVDADWLKGLVKKKAGSFLSQASFVAVPVEDGADYRLAIQKSRLPFTSDGLGEIGCFDREQYFRGSGLSLVVWGGAQNGTCDKYSPEWVTSIGDLKTRAEELHCLEPLEKALKRLNRACDSFVPKFKDQRDRRVPLTVTLIARRPFSLIGSDNQLEIMPYRMSLGLNDVARFSDRRFVQPLNHREAVGIPLLRRLSGESETRSRPAWVLVGAGSLGSKIGLHLARQGDGPKAVIDKRALSPHHMARHALTSQSDSPAGFIEPSKARRFSNTLSGLDQQCDPHEVDIRNLIVDEKVPWHRRDRALVNTTASLAVRNMLCKTQRSNIPRIVEAALFDKSKIGVLAIEAKDRSVRATDLFERLRLLGMEDTELQTRLFSVSEDQNGLGAVMIGQGCGAMTMTASDTDISIIAAMMTDDLARVLTEPNPDAPSLILYERWAVTGGVRRRDIPDTGIVEMTNSTMPDWSFRLQQRAADFIDSDISNWPGVETGGVLIGRRCYFTRQVYIVAALPAPADSLRSENRFELGVHGRAAAIAEYTQALGAGYDAIGTWHNHLKDSAASQTDLKMAQSLKSESGLDPVCIIRSPKTWRVFTSPSGGQGAKS